MPPPSSPVPRLSSVLSAVLTVHTIANRPPLRPLSQKGREGRPPRPLLGDVIATPRHYLGSDQQPQGSASGCRSSCPPRPRPLPLRQVVKVGRRASQGGRSPPAHPVDPLHPCRGASEYMRTPPRVGEGVVSAYQGGGTDLRESLFRDFLRGCIALNINYLFSPKG